MNAVVADNISPTATTPYLSHVHAIDPASYGIASWFSLSNDTQFIAPYLSYRLALDSTRSKDRLDGPFSAYDLTASRLFPVNQFSQTQERAVLRYCDARAVDPQDSISDSFTQTAVFKDALNVAFQFFQFCSSFFELSSGVFRGKDAGNPDLLNHELQYYTQGLQSPIGSGCWNVAFTLAAGTMASIKESLPLYSTGGHAILSALQSRVAKAPRYVHEWLHVSGVPWVSQLPGVGQLPSISVIDYPALSRKVSAHHPVYFRVARPSAGAIRCLLADFQPASDLSPSALFAKAFSDVFVIHALYLQAAGVACSAASEDSDYESLLALRYHNFLFREAFLYPNSPLYEAVVNLCYPQTQSA